MKKIIAAMAFVALLMGVSCKNNNKETDMEDKMSGPVVVMETTKGTMKIKLYNATPKHRDNFLKLVDGGFYDGVKFHRVIEGFMIQGGDPYSKDDSLVTRWGTGGPGYTVPAEFDADLHHCKGALAAARLGDMANPMRASSGSQFYIVQSERGCAHLDGQYTVYGQVIEGLEVIDAVAEVQVDPYDRPIVPVVITKVYRDLPAEEPVAPADSTASADSTMAPDSTK